MSRGGIKRTAGTVSYNFGSHIRAGKRIKLFCSMLLLMKKTGLKQIRIPAMLRIEQTAPREKQQK